MTLEKWGCSVKMPKCQPVEFEEFLWSMRSHWTSRALAVLDFLTGRLESWPRVNSAFLDATTPLWNWLCTRQSLWSLANWPGGMGGMPPMVSSKPTQNATGGDL